MNDSVIHIEDLATRFGEVSIRGYRYVSQLADNQVSSVYLAESERSGRANVCCSPARRRSSRPVFSGIALRPVNTAPAHSTSGARPRAPG